MITLSTAEINDILDAIDYCDQQAADKGAAPWPGAFQASQHYVAENLRDKLKPLVENEQDATIYFQP